MRTTECIEAITALFVPLVIEKVRCQQTNAKKKEKRRRIK